MSFRDENDALRARIETLEREAARARELEAEVERLRVVITAVPPIESPDEAAARARKEEAKSVELERRRSQANRELDVLRASRADAQAPRPQPPISGVFLVFLGVALVGLVAWGLGHSTSVASAPQPAPDYDTDWQPAPPTIGPSASWTGHVLEGDPALADAVCEMTRTPEELFIVVCNNRELARVWAPCVPPGAVPTHCASPPGQEPWLRADFRSNRLTFTSNDLPVTVQIDEH